VSSRRPWVRSSCIMTSVRFTEMVGLLDRKTSGDPDTQLANAWVRVQPSTGRYFPIEPSRLVAMTRDWPLSGGAGSEPRRLRNPHHPESSPTPLAVLRPGRDVTVYSLPTGVDTGVGQQAVMKALEVLARWKTDPIEPEGRSRSIVVYLHGVTQLRVVDECLKYTRRKFGAGEGLSTARKPKVTSRSMTDLATVNLD
jgi:hypothetical protein